MIFLLRTTYTKRICSECQATRTGRNLKSTKRGKYYLNHRWQKDGKGGWLCSDCYDHKRNLENPLRRIA